jgi:hypothetical protein
MIYGCQGGTLIQPYVGSKGFIYVVYLGNLGSKNIAAKRNAVVNRSQSNANLS